MVYLYLLILYYAHIVDVHYILYIIQILQLINWVFAKGAKRGDPTSSMTIMTTFSYSYSMPSLSQF